MEGTGIKGFLDELCGSKSAVTGVVFLNIILILVSVAETVPIGKRYKAYRHAEEKYTVTAALTGTSKSYDKSSEEWVYYNDWQYEVGGSYQHFENVTTFEPNRTMTLEVYRDESGACVVYQNESLQYFGGLLAVLLLTAATCFVLIRHELLMGRKCYQNR